GVEKYASQPEAPESPDDTKVEIPSAAACWNSGSAIAAPEGLSYSHPPQLTLITWAGTGVVSTRYSIAGQMPVPLTTSRICAPGATLPTRATSSVDSSCSPFGV